MAEETNDNIELRSEEVQEVMGMIPSWIVRWGITLLFGVIVLLLIGSCFFRYPDVLTTEMTLTSREPVARLVSRTAGKISYLGVKDGENVGEGTLLAVIENPAETGDVLWLEKQLRGENKLTPDTLVNHLLLKGKELALGEIQSAYSALLSALHDYQNEQELSYYPKKITSIRQQIGRHKAYYHRLQRQQSVVAAQDSIAARQYARDSLLYVQKVIATYEHETARTTLLQSHYELESAYAALESQRIQIGELEETLLDLYCGAGTIGLSMAQKVKRLIGVEVVPEAIASAKENARRNGIAHAEFLCADAETAAARLQQAGIKPDVVIVDPPRKGCGATLPQTIDRMRPKKLLYISCDPATLARDCAALADLGWQIQSAAPIDLFPGTAHVETIVLLSKNIV